MRRLIRAIARPVKSALRPLRLRLIDWQAKQSSIELERLYDMRDDMHKLADIEHRHQVKLAIRRQQIERGA